MQNPNSVLTSPGELQSTLMDCQTNDPAAVTLPNLCSRGLVQLKAEGFFMRCFSVAVKNAHAMPEDKWEVMAFPEEMPAPLGLPDNVKVHPTYVCVDHITCGLLGKNQLQGVLGEENQIKAITMYPPDGVEDASAHWEAFAGELSGAKKALDALKLERKVDDVTDKLDKM